MYIWKEIAHKLEQITGYRVVSLPDHNTSINTREMILIIKEIALTSEKDCYEVKGDLAIKYAHTQDWNVLTQLLDMQLTGTQARMRLTTYKHGFMAMSIAFDLHVWRDDRHVTLIKEVSYGTN